MRVPRRLYFQLMAITSAPNRMGGGDTTSNKYAYWPYISDHSNGQFDLFCAPETLKHYLPPLFSTVSFAYATQQPIKHSLFMGLYYRNVYSSPANTPKPNPIAAGHLIVIHRK